MPPWRTLAAAIRTLERRLARGEDIDDAPTPRLDLNLQLVPGEYWLFHPSWFNVRWWWQELLTAATQSRATIIRLGAYYVHERTLRVYARNNRGRGRAFREHLAATTTTRESLMELSSMRLFALREKVAWLAYEIACALTKIYLKPHRVGYLSVCRALKQIPPGTEHFATIDKLKKILSFLGDEDMRELFDFRHGYVHRLRPRVGIQQPVLLQQREPGVWDSIKTDAIASRRVVHAAAHAWVRLLHAIEVLAEVDLPPTGILVSSRRKKPRRHLDPWFGVHSKVSLHTDYGSVRISCMRECRGFKAELSLAQRLEPKSEQASHLLECMSDLLLKVIPCFELEKYGGHIKGFVLDSPNGQNALLFLTSDEAATPLASTVVERYGVVLADQLNRTALVGLAEAEQIVRDGEQFHDWPVEAKEVLVTILRGEEPPTTVVGRENRRKRQLTRRVVFRATGGTDPIRGTLSTLVIHREAEPVQRGT
jgi:hypothetical protein